MSIISLSYPIFPLMVAGKTKTYRSTIAVEIAFREACSKIEAGDAKDAVIGLWTQDIRELEQLNSLITFNTMPGQTSFKEECELKGIQLVLIPDAHELTKFSKDTPKYFIVDDASVAFNYSSNKLASTNKALSTIDFCKENDINLIIVTSIVEHPAINDRDMMSLESLGLLFEMGSFVLTNPLENSGKVSRPGYIQYIEPEVITELRTFSARAECSHDFIQLLQAPHWFKAVTYKPLFRSFNAPDITLEFQTNATLEQLREALRKIDDSHVLMQTLRQCPLEDNSLDRDFDIE